MKSTPYFATGNGKQNVILGTAPTIGKPTVPQQEVVLHADGTTLDGWQTGNSTMILTGTTGSPVSLSYLVVTH
ncbi:hypothetical protein P7H06_25550 [Paenibacillus larvae]|nr:hypothetical protein [Paenibacillus larvae]MDT2262183.1 hypothetical protein [Paenibacillus larvae]